MALGLGLRAGLYSLVQEVDTAMEAMEQTDPRGGQQLWADLQTASPQTFINAGGGRQLARPQIKDNTLGTKVTFAQPWYYGPARQDLNSASSRCCSWGHVNTIEYLWGSNVAGTTATNTTLATATAYSDTCSITILETLSKHSFLSVKLVAYYYSAFAVGTGLTGTRVTFKLGGGAVQTFDRSHATTAVTGRLSSQVIETDVTQVFRDQWSGTNMIATATIAVSTAAASAVTAQAFKLVITYAMDPAVQPLTQEYPIGDGTLAPWRMKTIRIPVQSHDTTLTTSYAEIGAVGTLPKSTQFPNLSTYLPENGKVFVNVALESHANPCFSAVTNFTPTVRFAGGADNPRATMVPTTWTAADPPWRDHVLLVSSPTKQGTGTFPVNASATIEWKSDLTARMGQICGFIIVTYAYRADTTTDVMCEAIVPLNAGGGAETGFINTLSSQQPTSGDKAPPYYRLRGDLFVPESSPSIKQSCAFIMFEVTSTASDLGVSMNQGAFRTYTPVTTVGETPVIHRIEDGFTNFRNGSNRIELDVYNASLPAGIVRAHVSSAYALINYTASLTNQSYAASSSVGGRDPNEGGVPATQLDPSRCTRPLCFLQRQHDMNSAFSAGLIDSWQNSEPNVPMLGSKWTLRAAMLERLEWAVGSSNKSMQLMFEMLTNELGGPGWFAIPSYPGTTAGTGYATGRHFVNLARMYDPNSDSIGKLDPEKQRRNLAQLFSGNASLYSASAWLTVSNHCFEVKGEISQDASLVSIPDGTEVNIYAYDETALTIDPSVGNDLSDFGATFPAEHIASVLTTGVSQGGRSSFQFVAHDDRRAYFAVCEGTTYPSKSPDNNPGNGNDFTITTFTAAPGGGGLAIPTAGSTYIR